MTALQVLQVLQLCGVLLTQVPMAAHLLEIDASGACRSGPRLCCRRAPHTRLDSALLKREPCVPFSLNKKLKGTHEANLMFECFNRLRIGARPLPFWDRVNRKRELPGLRRSRASVTLVTALATALRGRPADSARGRRGARGGRRAAALGTQLAGGRRN